MREEMGWVIEAAGPRYWNGKGLEPHNFTDRHECAVRFARFEDGEVVRCWLLEKFYQLLATREHMWIG